MSGFFVFPGQGSQQPGMGQSMAERDPEAAELYDRASAALGYDLPSHLCPSVFICRSNPSGGR